MNSTYKDYDYPLNLLIDLFGVKKLPAYRADGFLDILDHVLDTLPKQVKAAVLLRYREKMIYREIADALNRSASAAGALVNQGLRLLRHPDRTGILLGKND